MKRLKITFLFCCLFGKMMAQDCLLLQTENLDSLIAFVEKKYEGSWRLNYLKRAKGELKDSLRKEKANHLYSYARQFLKKKLSDEMICKRVGITEPGFIKVSDEKIQMGFIFYYDENNHSANIYNPKITFSSNLKSGKTTVNYNPSNKLIPNCKDFPDSCKFLVHNVVEAFEYAKEKGIIPKSYHNNYIRKAPPPYHFSLPYGKEVDCIRKCLFLNMYTGETHLSEEYRRQDCLTWSDWVGSGDLVIEGEVKTEPKAVMFEGKIFTKAEVEVRKVFKGKLNEKVIEVMTPGGSLLLMSETQGHAHMDPGYKGDLSIFFLKQNVPWAKIDVKKADSLTMLPIYHFTAGQKRIYSKYNPRFPEQIEKTIYQKIEKETGQDRKIISWNQTENEEILKWLMFPDLKSRIMPKANIPDRQNGLAVFYKTYLPDVPVRHVPIRISVGGANRHSYLDQLKLKVSYNEKAFGANLISIQKLIHETSIIKHQEDRTLHDIFPKGYDYKIKEIDATSFEIHFFKKDSTADYFQVPPMKDYEMNYPLVDLFFPILSENEPANIKITPVGETNAVDLKTGKSEKYDYVFCSRPLDKPASEYWKPVIDDFFPAEARVGDTVTIQGKYLKDSQIEIYGKTGRDIWFRGSVAPRYVIAQSNSEIKFIIPEKLESSKIGREILKDETLTPTTGTILLYKKQNRLKTYTRRKSLKIIE